MELDTKELLLEKVRLLDQDAKYDEVIAILEDKLLEGYKDANLYIEKASALYKIKDLDLFEINVLKALSLDSENPRVINCQGIILAKKGDNQQALKNYIKSIKIDPNYASAHYNLGLLYNKTRKFDNAVIHFERALELNPELNIYNSLGIAYKNLKDVENAVYNFSKSIEIDPINAAPFYNRAGLLLESKNYKDALKDYLKYLELDKGQNLLFYKIAKAKTNEIRKLIKSAEYSAINDLVNKVKNLLKYDDGCITHYTSLSVAKTLILDQKKLLRLSEGSFLNDTSEGRELFNFLNFHHLTKKNTNTIAEEFSQKPFIGSFVAEVKHDDLTLWRMYGKENKEEAKGCALTIDMKMLLDDLNSEVIAANESYNSDEAKSSEEFCFYKVAYRKSGQDNKFIIPNSSKEDENELNRLIKELLTKIKLFNSKKRKKSEDIQNIQELLNEIAYLFKSDEYQFENEVRLVLKGISFEKK